MHCQTYGMFTMVKKTLFSPRGKSVFKKQRLKQFWDLRQASIMTHKDFVGLIYTETYFITGNSHNFTTKRCVMGAPFTLCLNSKGDCCTDYVWTLIIWTVNDLLHLPPPIVILAGSGRKARVFQKKKNHKKGMSEWWIEAIKFFTALQSSRKLKKEQV